MPRTKSIEELEAELKRRKAQEEEDEKEVEPDFSILSVRKFDSDKPSYEVEIDHGGTKTTITVPHHVWYAAKGFRREYHATTDRFLAPVKQTTWEAMVSAVKPAIVKTSPETSINGMILEAVDNLTRNAHEFDDHPMGYAKTFALKDDEGRYYLRTHALTMALPAGVPVTRQIVGAVLAAAGWVSRQIEVEQMRPRFWVLEPKTNPEMTKQSDPPRAEPESEPDPEIPF